MTSRVLLANTSYSARAHLEVTKLDPDSFGANPSFDDAGYTTEGIARAVAVAMIAAGYTVDANAAGLPGVVVTKQHNFVENDVVGFGLAFRTGAQTSTESLDNIIHTAAQNSPHTSGRLTRHMPYQYSAPEVIELSSVTAGATATPAPTSSAGVFGRAVNGVTGALAPTVSNDPASNGTVAVVQAGADLLRAAKETANGVSPFNLETSTKALLVGALVIVALVGTGYFLNSIAAVKG